MRRHNLTGGQAFPPGFQLIEGYRPGPVLVAVGQVKNEIAEGGNAEPFELLGCTGTDAGKVRYGGVGGFSAAGLGHQPRASTLERGKRLSLGSSFDAVLSPSLVGLGYHR